MIVNCIYSLTVTYTLGITNTTTDAVLYVTGID